jgi:hypothetical protein
LKNGENLKDIIDLVIRELHDLSLEFIDHDSKLLLKRTICFETFMIFISENNWRIIYYYEQSLSNSTFGTFKIDNSKRKFI